jgi:hypothetical protein
MGTGMMVEYTNKRDCRRIWKITRQKLWKKAKQREETREKLQCDDKSHQKTAREKREEWVKIQMG